MRKNPEMCERAGTQLLMGLNLWKRIVLDEIQVDWGSIGDDMEANSLKR